MASLKKQDFLNFLKNHFIPDSPRLAVIAFILAVFFWSWVMSQQAYEPCPFREEDCTCKNSHIND